MPRDSLLPGLLALLLAGSVLGGGRDRRQASSAQIEEAMVNGLFEVPPPDLSPEARGVEGRGLRGWIIRSLEEEADRSQQAANRLDEEAGLRKYNRDVVRQKFYSQKQDSGKNVIRDTADYLTRKFQTSFHNWRTIPRGLIPQRMRGPTIAIADFSNEGRERLNSVWRPRNILQSKRKGRTIPQDRNRMDTIGWAELGWAGPAGPGSDGQALGARKGRQLQFISNQLVPTAKPRGGSGCWPPYCVSVEAHQPRRLRKASSESVRGGSSRQGLPPPLGLDSTTGNGGGLLGAAHSVMNGLFQIGVSIAFFLS